MRSNEAAESPASGPASDRSFEAWFLGWPLSAILVMICGVQLATWLPHYLTWPYWADHDTFAAVARAWDQGLLPYRDTRLNNFPGSVYLFYLLGKAFGWGRPIPFYGFAAGLLLGFGAVLLA